MISCWVKIDLNVDKVTYRTFASFIILNDVVLDDIRLGAVSFGFD